MVQRGNIGKSEINVKKAALQLFSSMLKKRIEMCTIEIYLILFHHYYIYNNPIIVRVTDGKNKKKLTM